MNRDEIERRVLEAINDDPDTPVFFDNDQLARLVDEANEMLAEDTGAIRRTAILALREGVGYISTTAIDPDFMAPIRIWNHGLNQRLICLSMTEMDGLNVSWQTVTGTPEVWFPVSWDMLGIYPRPATAGSVLRIDYQAWPRGLMDGSDRSELPEATHDALVLYGEFQGLLKKWDSEQASERLKALQLHKAVAGSRSGIARIAVRSFQRPQSGGGIAPSTYQKGT